MALPKLIPGYGKHQAYRFPKRLPERRWNYPLAMCRMMVEDNARRTAASRRFFRWKFYRGDCHSHTQHSDGAGTVAETAEMVKAAGLDFQWVTDHWGITQGPECRKHGLWVGQEPVTKFHHIGILGLEHAYAPQQDFLADMAELKRRGAIAFVPHPTGWWPQTVYGPESCELLENLPDPFLMEICNGANNIVTAFDYTDDSAVRQWDDLLMQGKVVHAMGNTDAHAPHAIGIVWNSVFAARCTEPSILAALCRGDSFVSDGPLVHIALGRTTMGRRVTSRRQRLRLTAVESRGLANVRVIADRRVIREWAPRGAVRIEQSVPVPRFAKRYVRVEVRAVDGRRAYSNPIYL